MRRIELPSGRISWTDTAKSVSGWSMASHADSLKNPRGMTLDGTTLWVADGQNQRVLKVSAATGQIVWEFNRVNEGSVPFTDPLDQVNVGIGLGSFGIDSGEILFGWHTRGYSPGAPEYFPGLVRVSKMPPEGAHHGTGRFGPAGFPRPAP